MTQVLDLKTSPFLEAIAAGTIYNMNFDWSSAEQNAILSELQNGNYKLFGYKGATGPEQVTAGLPTWFAVDYTTMFGITNINYIPKYKVYFYNEANIGTDTTITMQALSAEVSLGTIVEFDQTGRFTTKPGAPAGTITVVNKQSSTSNTLTTGLAAYVNGAYAPFCAFTSRPQNSVNMAPNEKVCIFAGQTGLVSGSVNASSTAPGCTFEFNSSNIKYDLKMIANTLGITNTATSPSSVTETASDTNLGQLLNS